jgi:hypothetical protein
VEYCDTYNSSKQYNSYNHDVPWFCLRLVVCGAGLVANAAGGKVSLSMQREFLGSDSEQTAAAAACCFTG